MAEYFISSNLAGLIVTAIIKLLFIQDDYFIYFLWIIAIGCAFFSANKALVFSHKLGFCLFKEARSSQDLVGINRLISKAISNERVRVPANSYLPSLFFKKLHIARQHAVLTVSNDPESLHTTLYVEQNNGREHLRIRRIDFFHSGDNSDPSLYLTGKKVAGYIKILDTESSTLDRARLKNTQKKGKHIQRSFVISSHLAEKLLLSLLAMEINSSYQIQGNNCYLWVLKILRSIDCLPVELALELRSSAKTWLKIPGYQVSFKNQENFFERQIEASQIKYLMHPNDAELKF